MSLVILSVTVTELTNERFQLDFFVPEGSWEGNFDRLEVWRSRGTDQGPYEQLHDTGAMPAVLPIGAGPPPASPQTGPSIPLNGLLLQFLLDGKVPVNIIFSGTDPFTFAQAATQIQAQSQGLLVAYVLGPLLVVRTVEVGVKTSLACVGGDAAPLLGLPTSGAGSLAFGRDARIVLVRGQEEYGFVDPNGAPSFFYQARFFSSANQTVSQFSRPFQGTITAGLSTASLCRCYVDLVDMTGSVLPNQEVLIYNRFNGVQAESKAVTGGSLKLLTDSNGHAEALLARGADITVSIPGTALARDVTVPADPTIESLNLLASSSGTDDLFDVAIPNIPFAVRRTL
jgi:hypothetical protein